MSCIAPLPEPAAAAEIVTPRLVQVIDTSRLSPPIPDPADLAFIASGDLLVADSEVEEMSSLYQGRNIFRLTTSGDLVDSFKTTRHSNEPAGMTTKRRTIFISDDDKDMVFVVRPGRDHRYGTRDDKVRSFRTSPFGCNDPEGIAIGGGFLFIADGKGTEVFRLSPGRNGVFDGVQPEGDDRVRHFDTSRLDQPDPEGIEYNRAQRSLFIVSNWRSSDVVETTITGELLRVIDLAGLGMRSPAGLAYGPGSADPSVASLYIADRGIDNDGIGDENDGRIFEISF